MKLLALAIFAAAASVGIAQEKSDRSPGEKILAEADVPNGFKKKFRFGLSWNQYWGTIKGTNLPEEYFAKPCVGASVRAEFYPLPFLGIGAGFGVQQRGAGIINEDHYGGPYTHPWITPWDVDSTHLERLRMNTIEVPVTLLLRTPADVIKGVRLSGAAGVVLFRNDYVRTIFNSPGDGAHTITDVSTDYIKNDVGLHLSCGADINVAESSIFQVHLVYSRGARNVYATGSRNGRAETYGVRVAWLF